MVNNLFTVTFPKHGSATVVANSKKEAHEKANEDGTIIDRCFSWETGQTYANAGYEVQAVNDDGSIDKATAQSIYDRERELAADCFGPGIRENY